LKKAGYAPDLHVCCKYVDVPYSLLGNQSFENQLFSIIIYNLEREKFLSGKTTGGNNSYVGKLREGIIPRWINHGRE